MADLLMQSFEQFSLSHQQPLKMTSKNGHFIVSLTQQPSPTSPSLIAACTMGPNVHLIDPSTLSVSSMAGLQTAPKKPVFTYARFGAEGNRHCLYAISKSHGIFKWDPRTARQPAQRFDCESITSLGLTFLSMDLSCDGGLLAAGSSVTSKGDAFIGFWDARSGSSGSFLGVYSNSHSEDVTSLAFHPSESNRLLSGSCDGLLCRFDLHATGEDDALDLSCNTDRSVARVGWGRLGRCGNRLLAVTGMETFHVWDGEGEPEMEALELPSGWRYIVDCLPDGETLLIGNHDGKLAVLKAGQSRPSCRLRGGHSDTVRSAVVLADGCLVTGGEDGVLCAWRGGPAAEGERAPTKRQRLEDEPEISKKQKKKCRKSVDTE